MRAKMRKGRNRLKEVIDRRIEIIEGIIHLDTITIIEVIKEEGKDVAEVEVNQIMNEEEIIEQKIVGPNQEAVPLNLIIEINLVEVPPDLKANKEF